MQKYLLLFVVSGLALFCISAASQERFVSPAHLSGISQSWAYSMTQDREGAMWISTNIGVFRYNGHTLDKVLAWGEKGHAVSGGGSVYVKTGGKVAAVNIGDRSVELWQFGEEYMKDGSALFAEGDSLFVSVGSSLYMRKASMAEPELLPVPEEMGLIGAIHRTASGLLLLGTEKGVVSLDGSLRIDTSDQVLALSDAPDGEQVLIGLKNGGFCIADLRDGRISEMYPSCNGKAFLNVRSFATVPDGRIYIGTASGLFRRDADGKVSEIPLNGELATPIYEVYRDRDGNVWVGTCYFGVFYANVSTYHFRPVTPPVANGPVRGFAQDSGGTVWAATDAFGMHRYVNGKWVMVPGSYGIKHQCIMYDRDADAIYSADWSGRLLRYGRNGKIETAGIMGALPAGEVGRYAAAMDKCGGDFVLATQDGAFLFDPSREKLIVRKIEGTEGKIRDVAVGPDGRIWMGGNGLSCYDGKELRFVIEPGGLYIQSLEFSPDGTLWCATETGIASVANDSVRIIDSPGSGIFAQSMNYIMPLGRYTIAAGTKKGLVFLDIENGLGRMYDQGSGLSFRSTMSSACLRLQDGSIWFGGIGGIEALDAGHSAFHPGNAPLCIDALLANGERIGFEPGRKTVLNHTQTNISIDLADYDFSEILSAEYVCMLDGFDKDWRPIDIREKAEYMNLRPGSYCFRVREAGNPQSGPDRIILPIRIKHVWYASPLFIMLEALALIAMLLLFIRYRYTKAVLTEKLRLKEEENRKQTSFFINLSFKMRTPLNLIIGNLEQYFREHGARARGVEDIQEIYDRAKGLRGVISEYVDTQNEALEREPRHAKTINAVLGVVERNLFTKELNVGVLCDELNMGKTKLTEVMKEATGMTPGEYIEDVRLRHAAQMLQNGYYSVNEVADKLGFSSASYFSVRFKKLFGVAPSRYGKESCL